MAVNSIELTTIADDMAVCHRGETVLRYEGLAPDTEFAYDGVSGRTLPRPGGELLCRFVTVNDLHFGEVECGVVDDHTDGPILRRKPGESPYPELMNNAAVREIVSVAPDSVIVKGDLTRDGTDEEWAAFEACYRGAFGDDLYVVRGNHDAYRGQTAYSGDQWIELPGLNVALLDTTVGGSTPGRIEQAQLEWLDDQLMGAGRTIVLGHHQQWVPAGQGPPPAGFDYFGLDPASSGDLDALCARHPTVIAYAAGHTHRHRVRRMAQSGVPSIEVGCVKDFPGTWAEYRVYEGGVTQVVHRISDPEALAWSNRCRVLYRDFGVDYETYAAGDLSERCFVLPVAA